ncbi:DUF2264 domain-containing protein [Terriglobus roseus]|nr:DUF2264 domain-containing protein [Terriglobus roseus]
MNRRRLLTGATGSFAALLTPSLSSASFSSEALAESASSMRSDWTELLVKIVDPVLRSAAAGTLFEAMPVEAAAGQEADRRGVSPLEALARTLSGIAPWLENTTLTGAEEAERARCAALAQKAIAMSVDSGLPSYLRFGSARQTIVDAGFLSLAMARAPRTLLHALPEPVKKHLGEALRATRRQTPPYNNWLLFAAMVEACLSMLGEDWDRERVDYALREHAAWFLGDGIYGDGPHFHADNYNSYVIHPFLVALMEVVGDKETAWTAMRKPIVERAKRFAALQERSINPDGSFPPIGRSIAYRCGAYHHLADAALRRQLPEHLSPAQARCALNAVIKRTMLARGTFDTKGWLTIGLAGHQPSLGETYISTGSLYLCTTAFLPLGLPASDPFWSGAAEKWSSLRIWSGEDHAADHATD